MSDSLSSNGSIITPVDGPAPSPTRSLSADEVNNLLKEGSDDNKDPAIPPDGQDKEPKKVKDKTDKTDKEDDDKDDDKDDDDDIELKDDEEEEKIDLDEDDEDDEEKKGKEDDIEIDAPPKKKELVAAYPDILKKFPWFEKMIYRDREYTNLFGSFDDAKEAADDAAAFKAFEHDLMQGSTEKILSSIKEGNKKAFDRLVDNYLPTLYKVDKEAYIEITGNIGKQFIKELAEVAGEFERQGSENSKENSKLIKQAALILNQHLFGNSTWTPPKTRIDPEIEKREAEEAKARQNEVHTKLQETETELQGRVDKVLRATIADYIDPKGEMSPFVKKHAIREALTALHETLKDDKEFRGSLNKQWDNVFTAKFSRDAVEKVYRMYLGKAKGALRPVINKARREALNQKPARRESDSNSEEREERTSRRETRITTGRPHQSRGKDSLTRRPGETVAQFLARD